MIRAQGEIWGDLRAVAALAAAMLPSLLPACGRSPAALVVANGADLQNLDPHQATSRPDARVMQSLCAGLTRLDPATLQPLPELSESWEVSADGRAYTFELRLDLKWSDGSPLTADDFVASWLRLLDLNHASAYKDWLIDIDGARTWRETADYDAPPAGLRTVGNKLHVRFVRPMPQFAAMCAYHVLAPLHAQLRNAALGDPLEDVPSSGAFQLSERRIRDRIRVARNPHYWNAARVALADIDFLTVESQFTALNLFLTGRADYLSDVPPLALPALRQREVARAAEAGADFRPEFDPSPYLGVYFYRFNTTAPPLDDVRVRQALALSVDRALLAAAIGQGQPAAFSYVPPGMGVYQPAATGRFDPAAARELLTAAGYGPAKPFPTIEAQFNTSEMHRDVAEVLQAQWKEHLGIDVRLANNEFKIVQSQQRQLDYQMSRSSWIADYADPENFLEVFRGGALDNRTGWANAEYDALLDRAQLAASPEARAHTLAEAEALLLDEAPILPLFFYMNLDLVAARVNGYARNAQGYVDWSRLSVRPADAAHTGGAQ